MITERAEIDADSQHDVASDALAAPFSLLAAESCRGDRAAQGSVTSTSSAPFCGGEGIPPLLFLDRRPADPMRLIS